MTNAPTDAHDTRDEVVKVPGECAFTAWAADALPLIWTWDEMPASQRERWGKIAAAVLDARPASPVQMDGLEAMRAHALAMVKKHGDPNGTDYEQGQNDMGFRWFSSLDRAIEAAPIARGVDRAAVAQAAWDEGRRIALEEGEDDNGPWPPRAGHFGWQEDDSEMVCRVERAKADAILALLNQDGEGGK